MVARPLSLNTLNYLPSGPTATIFALLAQYHAVVPHVFRYRLGTTTSTPSDVQNSGTGNGRTASSPTATPKPAPPSLTILLSDKSTTYIVAAQLALSQFPTMLLPAAVGWIVGTAWRAELLPGLSPSATGFRVPAWMVGERERRSGNGNGSAEGTAERERYEDLRRRLEGEVAASTSGLDSASGSGQRRRNGGDANGEGSGQEAGLMERLRGAW